MFSNEELEKISSNPDTDLCKIMNLHLSDKGNGHHNYTKLYDKLFKELRYKNLNILEIGIGSVNIYITSNMSGGELGKIYKPGASLRGWNEYFPYAQIYGCDIDKDILNFPEPRIQAFYLDQTNQDQIKDTISTGILKDVEFDIIIDDGLHHFPTNASVLNTLIGKVKKGGYYIIEDILNYEYNFDYINKEILKDKEWQYITLPNPKNTVDNNLFIVKVQR